MRDRLKKHLAWFWRTWGKPLFIAAAIVIPLRSSIADWHDVPTGSMKPTILEGDRVFVNKLAYDLKVPLTRLRLARWADPRRGDIVVCFSPADGKRLVKRIIGIPGDVVAMRSNRLSINGKPMQYVRLDADAFAVLAAKERSGHVFAQENLTGARHPVMFTPGLPARRTFRPVTVPEGRYLVMGDNRDNSLDSRSFGFIARTHIVGRVKAVVFSRRPDKDLPSRRGRWFKKLR